eukprot:scaffold19904_cov27-Tisochrysis_lutea.AAC.1
MGRYSQLKHARPRDAYNPDERHRASSTREVHSTNIQGAGLPRQIAICDTLDPGQQNSTPTDQPGLSGCRLTDANQCKPTPYAYPSLASAFHVALIPMTTEFLQSGLPASACAADCAH